MTCCTRGPLWGTDYPTKWDYNVKDIFRSLSVFSQIQSHTLGTKWFFVDVCRVSLKSLCTTLCNCWVQYYLFFINQMTIDQPGSFPVRALAVEDSAISPWKCAALASVIVRLVACPCGVFQCFTHQMITKIIKKISASFLHSINDSFK